MKGQSSVVGFMVITLIIIVVVGGTFLWAKDMIDQSNNFNDVARMTNRMREINNAIIDVANEQGQRSVSVEIKKGHISLEDYSNLAIWDNPYGADSDTIIYYADFNLPESKFSGGSVLIGNNSADGPCLNYSIIATPTEAYRVGTLGNDEPVCLIEQGETRLKLKYIFLNDTGTNNCYIINLVSEGSASISEGIHKILIRYIDTVVSSGSTWCGGNIIDKRVGIDME